MKGKILIVVLLILLVGDLIIMGIIHEDIKASGDKGLAEEWNKDHVIDGDVDQEQHQFLNAVIENRVDFPAAPVIGQHVYRTDTKQHYIYDGAAWIVYTGQLDPAIPHGTYYWSCAGSNFKGFYPATDPIYYDLNNGNIKAEGGLGEGVIVAPVFLPHGAVVTGAEVFGTDATEDWTLFRRPLGAGASSIMATDNINTEDITITNPTIDNENYSYFLEAGMGNGDFVYGARITYTL